MSLSQNDIFKSQLDYAWKWFDLHAKQRMTLFNYFLIITGILLNSYVISINYKLYILSISVCVVGIFQSIAFLVFDIRNRQLISYSEDILEKLERDVLFREDFKHSAIRGGKKLGLLFRDSQNKMRENQGPNVNKLIKMKWWIRIMYWLVQFTFFAGLLYAIDKTNT